MCVCVCVCVCMCVCDDLVNSLSFLSSSTTGQEAGWYRLSTRVRVVSQNGGKSVEETELVYARSRQRT